MCIEPIRKRLLAGLLAIVVIMVMLPAPTENLAAATTKTLYVGDTHTFKIQNTTKKIHWSSSNDKIATVNQKGKVKAKKPGTVVIKAKYGKTTKKYKVKVNHEILKYISKDWYTFGGQPYPTKYKFTNKYRYCYVYDVDTGKYSYYGKDKVSYINTDYGYYIIVDTQNGKNGYRLTLGGQGSDYILECIGQGEPYSEEGYSASSSLE